MPQVNIPRPVKLADGTWLGRLLIHAFMREVLYEWGRLADEASEHNSRLHGCAVLHMCSA